MPIKVEGPLDYGNVLRIGYRLNGSSGPYTYLNTYPAPEDLPYTFPVPAPGTYEVEVTAICPNCSGNRYSDPEVTILNSPT